SPLLSSPLSRQDSRRYEPLAEGELFFETFRDGAHQRPEEEIALAAAYHSHLSEYEGSADITGDERALLQLARQGGVLIKHGRSGKPHEKAVIRIRVGSPRAGPDAAVCVSLALTLSP